MITTVDEANERLDEFQDTCLTLTQAGKTDEAQAVRNEMFSFTKEFKDRTGQNTLEFRNGRMYFYKDPR